MSFLERIHQANQHAYNDLRPFCIAGRRVGCVNADFAATLSRWTHVFDVRSDCLTLARELDDPHTDIARRTLAIAEVLAALRDEGVIDGWRDEAYPVVRHWNEPPLALMERAAIPYFGIAAYGVHMNGYVRTPDGIKLWVARRSMTKPTGAGKLDQIVAGGQPHGIGLRENMRKECWEEASIPDTLAARLQSVGTISYTLRTALGFRPDVIFAFDLELPADFVPNNTDGEVDEFFLWDLGRVAEVVRDTGDFKFNSGLVVIDFLIRHGHIDADHPDYEQIVAGLHAPSTPAPSHWPA